MAAHTDVYRVLIELGLAIVGLALLARLANHLRFSAVPFYLLAGLCFGRGGLAPMDLSEDFIRIGAEIGVLLLLFMLGLEYGGGELRKNLRQGLPGGIADFLLNFSPGLIAGLILGWHTIPAVLLGGITYISSSGIVAKMLAESRRVQAPERTAIVSILVLEDLGMAIFLPLLSVLIAGGDAKRMVISVAVAVLIVAVVLVAALRYGNVLSKIVVHPSDEIVLLTMFGAVLVVAGFAQRFNVSAGVGAFLVGIAASGPLAEQTHRLLAPLRDLFAAIFFFFFGLEVNPSSLPPAIPVAAALGVVTAATKIITGYWNARRFSADNDGLWRAGVALIPRGEFSIVIAALGAAIEPQLGPISAAYVFLLAFAGPVLMRLLK